MLLFYLFFVLTSSHLMKWSVSQQNNNFVNYSDNMKVNLSGFMVAFGDFNADRATDIFVLDTVNGTQQIDVILMNKDSKADIKRITLMKDKTNLKIVAVIASDFNGDSVIDLIICRGVAGSYTMEIAYGKKDKSGVHAPVIIADGMSFLTQPLHLDWNADMIGDLLCQMSDKSFVVLLGQINSTFSIVKHTNIGPNMETVKYMMFVGVKNNGQSDILLVGRNAVGYVAMALFVKQGEQFEISSTFTGNESVSLIGQGVIGDFSASGQLSIVVPMCVDVECEQSYVLTCQMVILVEMNHDIVCHKDSVASLSLNGDRMQFVPGSKLHKSTLVVPDIAPLSCGDLFLTGNVVCLTIMTKLSNTSKTLLVTLNNDQHNTFLPKVIDGSKDLFVNVEQAAVFDLNEDGVPDILTAKQTASSGFIIPLFQVTSNDQYFIKVLVLNGRNLNSDYKLPYGLPLPGISVSYATESYDGDRQQSVATLCSDSAYTSLQLPYVIFGLGAFANYVEKLLVTLPSDKVPRKHTLSFIIPKTQIVVIPFPLDDPDQWTFKLFLEPFTNNNVIYVSFALIGSFCVVSIFVAVIQYMQTKTDRLEIMMDTQRFHFDAM